MTERPLLVIPFVIDLALNEGDAFAWGERFTVVGLPLREVPQTAQSKLFRSGNEFKNSCHRCPLGILATAPQTFIHCRELISARGHALLQLLLPIDNDVDLLGSPVDNVRQRRHDETLTVGHDVVRRRIT